MKERCCFLLLPNGSSIGNSFQNIVSNTTSTTLLVVVVVVVICCRYCFYADGCNIYLHGVLLDQLTGSQLVKKFLAFYGT
jgi:hypothetical protein